MKILSIIILVLNTTLCIAQNNNDSSYYFHYNGENMKEIEYCINNLKINGEINGIITITLCNKSKGYALEVSKITSSWDILHNTPDYYSYLKNIPVVWYFGKNKLSIVDYNFAQFLINKFSKQILINISYKEYLANIKDSITIKDVMEKNKIPVNDIQPAEKPENSKFNGAQPVYYMEFINGKLILLQKRYNLSIISPYFKKIPAFDNIGK